MALLTDSQVQIIWQEGHCERAALISCKNVTAADTIELSKWFTFVKRAGIVSATGTTIATMTLTSATLLTFPSGPSNDGLLLLTIGVAS